MPFAQPWVIEGKKPLNNRRVLKVHFFLKYCSYYIVGRYWVLFMYKNANAESISVCLEFSR